MVSEERRVTPTFVRSDKSSERCVLFTMYVPVTPTREDKDRQTNPKKRLSSHGRENRALNHQKAIPAPIRMRTLLPAVAMADIATWT